ncbi:hypothetical protein BDV26DRAFT_268009 [Aspergillus bertholletiae]|uniref:Uncharacterized protein n=1 Tax=Aspergillus bertholletiae TaxID=1226010 RepID=A0A5N7B021_9EURO|nr:hypothetical protein BDV26DRAFT_268009 [Aspergillus bertholletiae]
MVPSHGRCCLLTLLSAICVISLGLLTFSSRQCHMGAVTSLEERYPLLWKHVHNFEGYGGVWYIPASWVESGPQPQTIIEAVELTIHITDLGTAHCFIPCSLIPLIVHQTGIHRRIDAWPEDLRQSVERWLQFVVEDETAYFLWEDEGMAAFIDHFMPEVHEKYSSLPSMIEKTNLFRILVAQYVGGIVNPT